MRQLHRFILMAPPGVLVDHANGDGLDCRRSNLRLATNSQNQQNRFIADIEKTSRFKGVHWCDDSKRWVAQITLDGRSQEIGRFLDEIEAARAYDDAARRLFREFARTNDMMGLYPGQSEVARGFDGPKGKKLTTPMQREGYRVLSADGFTTKPSKLAIMRKSAAGRLKAAKERAKARIY